MLLLWRAATPQKVTDDTTNVDKTTQTLNPSSSSESDTDDPDSPSETGTESDTEEYESAMDSETEPKSAADNRMNQKEPDPASKWNAYVRWISLAEKHFESSKFVFVSNSMSCVW